MGKLDELSKQARSDSKVDLKQEMQNVMVDMLRTSPYRKRPTLKEEVQTLHHYIDVMMDALPRLEHDLKLDPGELKIRFKTWSGMEADRNSTTPEVQIQTVVLNRRHALERYIGDLRHVQSQLDQSLRNHSATRPLSRYIYRMVRRLKQDLKKLDEVQDNLEGLAALAIYEDAKLRKKDDPLPKYLADNRNQFFPGWTLKEIEDYAIYRSEDRLSATVNVGNTEKITEYVVEKEAEYRRRIAEYLTLSYKARKPDYSPEHFPQEGFRENLERVQGKLLEKFDGNDAASTLADSVRDILSRFSYFGFHLLEGQGRLDSAKMRKAMLEIIKPVVPKLKSYTDMTENERCQLLIEQICSGKLAKKIDPRTLTPKSRNVYNYFLTQRMLQKVDPHFEPELVIANYATTQDFLEAFYLLVQSGLVEIKDGEVVKADALLIPLLESVEDHDNGPKELEKLLSIPVIRSYIKKIGYVYMKAYSDTARDNSVTGALSRLYTRALDMNDVFKKAFSYDVSHLIENAGDLGMYGEKSVLWNEFYKSVDTEKGLLDSPEARMIVHHGQGDTRHRTGGDYVDLVMEWYRSESERLGKYRTWQSGQTPKRSMNIEASKHSLLREIYFSQSTPESKLFEAKLTSDHRKWICDFADPGIECYEKFKEKNGEVNKFLVTCPVVSALLNDMDIGSRVKDLRDIMLEYGPGGKAEFGLIGANRAITVSSIVERLGFDFGAILPFVESMEKFLGDDEGNHETKMDSLRNRYAENPSFRIFIDKHMEHWLFSSLQTLKLWIDPENSEHAALYRGWEEAYNKCKGYLDAITRKQTVGYFNDKKLGPKAIREIAFDRIQRHFGAKWLTRVYEFYKPLDFERRKRIEDFKLDISGPWMSVQERLMAKLQEQLEKLDPYGVGGLSKLAQAVLDSKEGDWITIGKKLKAALAQDKTRNQARRETLNKAYLIVQVMACQISRRVLIPMAGRLTHG